MAEIRKAFSLKLLALLMLVGLGGCNSAFMHELQPHRLWRLNRGPAPGNGALYSVDDPLPASNYDVAASHDESMTAAVIAPDEATE